APLTMDHGRVTNGEAPSPDCRGRQGLRRRPALHTLLGEDFSAPARATGVARARTLTMPFDTNLPSIVAVRAHIPDDAFTARGLGVLREGSGVVIGEHGLVLTIGYLITEADEVWLTRQDGQVFAAHVVGYDQATGFGLVQAMGDLDLPALELGSSSQAR